MLLISIHKEIYEVSQFISKHPGEGISNTYLTSYRNKETTREFEKYHYTNDSYDMLKKAKENGFDKDSKIYYVCPNLFNLRIPKYFYFFKDGNHTEFMDKKEAKTFILTINRGNIENSILLVYKNNNNKIEQKVILKIEDTWTIEWNNLTFNNSNIDKLMKSTIIEEGYQQNNYVKS